MKRLGLSMLLAVVVGVLPSCRKQAQSRSTGAPANTPSPVVQTPENVPPSVAPTIPAPSANTGDVAALLAAAKDGRLDVVKGLLAKGVPVNATGPGGETALHWVASYDHKDAAEFLLSNGASVNAKDKAGMTPLHLASQEGHVELVKLLLSKKAEVNAVNEDGVTPLHLAASGGHSAVIGLLCDSEADRNAQDSAGSTPFRRSQAQPIRFIIRTPSFAFAGRSGRGGDRLRCLVGLNSPFSFPDGVHTPLR